MIFGKIYKQCFEEVFVGILCREGEEIFLKLFKVGVRFEGRKWVVKLEECLCIVDYIL